MVDIKVQEVQKWLNATYIGYSQWNHLDEDGLIGWQTVFGLIRGLQIELGITTLSDNFGDGTMSALKSQYPVIGPTSNVHMRISLRAHYGVRDTRQVSNGVRSTRTRITQSNRSRTTAVSQERTILFLARSHRRC